MGMYVYRVTPVLIDLSDGTQANVAIYAYKPYGDHRRDHRHAFHSGCYASERMKTITDRIVIGSKDAAGNVFVPRNEWGEGVAIVYNNLRGWKTFLDDCNLGHPGRLPVADGVTLQRDVKPAEAA